MCAENVFSGEDLQILIDNKYYILSIGVSYLNTSPDYINWYNYERLHSTLDYKTPAEKELEITIKNMNKAS